MHRAVNVMKWIYFAVVEVLMVCIALAFADIAYFGLHSILYTVITAVVFVYATIRVSRNLL